MQCAVCSSNTDRLFQANGIWVRQCRPCQFRFAELARDASHVPAVYGNDYFFGGGAGYADYLSEEALLISHGRGYAKELAKRMSPGRLLDVGAAAGFLMKGFAEAGWSTTGLEPNAGLAHVATEKFGHAMHVGSLEDVQVDGTFDLVTMIQVAGHFYEVRKAFANAARVTRPGGYWLVETWNYRSWAARLFGKQWHEYSPPSVLQWFSPRSLQLLAEQFGMQCVETGKPVKHISGGHARSLLQYRMEKMGLGKLRSLAGAIPARARIRYPAVDLFWMLLRNATAHGRQT